MNAHIKRRIRKIISPIRRIGLKNRDFTIISNNCWGGVLYDIYGLQYKSPTIGLYFFAEEYIKFINNLEYYLSLDAKPLLLENSKHKEELIKRSNSSKLALIGDVEIVFVHYDSVEDGCKKWNNRRKRVNFDNILIKFNDQNLFTEKAYLDFKDCKFKNKIFFTAKQELCTEDYCICIDKYEADGYVVDDIKSSKKLIDYKKLFNNMIE